MHSNIFSLISLTMLLALGFSGCSGSTEDNTNIEAGAGTGSGIIPDGGGSGSGTGSGTGSGGNTAGFVTVSAGNFLMGSPSSENCRYTNETQHQVTLTRSFEIMSKEITQGDFQTEMKYNPSSSKSCGNSCPVENVSWYEVAAYCNALSTKHGYTPCYLCSGSNDSVVCQEESTYTGSAIYNCPGFRLPTEAEWEYAYRAGVSAALHNNKEIVNCATSDENANQISWNIGNSSSSPHPGGQKAANNWGIADMGGNVAEWTNDWYADDLGASSATDPTTSTGSFKSVRGGSFLNNPRFMRAAFREHVSPALRKNYLGARCVRTR